MLSSIRKYYVTSIIIKNCCRTLVTEVNQDNVTSKKVVPAKKKKSFKTVTEPKTLKALEKHFKASEQKFVLQTFPEVLLKKRTRLPNGFYLTNKKMARVIADELIKDIRPEQSLLEMNPGAGLLTKILLKETENDLFLYEPLEHFHPALKSLIKSHPERNISLSNKDFSTISYMALVDKIDGGNRISELLKGVQRTDYVNEPNARLFGATSSISFINALINSVIFQNSVTAAGRCEYFLIIPPWIFITLTCSNEAGYMVYRTISVLFQLLFEYEFIQKVSSEDLLPWQVEVKKMPYNKMGKFYLMDHDSMYLIRATPRQNIFEYCQPDNLTSLWHFIKQNFRRRKNCIIPTLEKWIPGCGPRLIINEKSESPPELINPQLDLDSQPKLCQPCRKLSNEDFINMTIFTQFGDLTPNQALTIFDQFINWPEFKDSTFKESLEATLVKIHTNPDDNINVDDDIHDDEDETKTSEVS
ncbi:CLUMA_CG003775, isoform A [Clunio marinus]|uniref:rRNA adenine N(6)-methyltransferase n=1 Tax=Clunio marinus TaxID=568069 RepID=A0A1J1HU80_9DIPT|nr:CLUMA_CG003775, isoform A [Clunio marinus]